MKSAHKLRAMLLMAGALLPALPASASVFQIFPVTVEAPAEAPAGVVTLSNASAEPMTLQVRIFRWSQQDGRDVLTPTRDVVASPPAATIQPGSQQIVRVVRTAKTPVTSEESYRLIVDEIPVARSAVTEGVRLLLRQSIPVFFGSSSKAAPRTVWQLERAAAGWELRATNDGPRRQRISDLEIRDEAGRLLEKRPGLVGYVLGQSEARWPLNLKDISAAPLKLVAVSDAGAVRVDLTSSSTQ